MLDLLNRYAHGFVTIPAILACRKQGFFELFTTQPLLTAQQLAHHLEANEGHLRVVIRMLESLGWLTRHSVPFGYEDHSYSLTTEAAVIQRIPADVTDLLHFPFDDYLTQSDAHSRLQPWISQSLAAWHISHPMLADFLDGLLLMPLLLALHRQGIYADGELYLRPLHETVRQELERLFVGKGWADGRGKKLELTDSGRFLLDRVLVLGTTASYLPMFAQIDELLFGNPRHVLGHDEAGHELHVDRTLNVVASGFQHGKFFADVDDIIIEIFSQPLDQQPNYVADMGCGDGTFLANVYEVIRTRSERGEMLDEHPVVMIGVDYNQKALDATTKTLTGIPHLVLPGDIGDPEQLLLDLQAQEINPQKVLHIRSFLDHDRPFIPPQTHQAVENRRRLPYEGVYVNESGGAIEPAVVMQSLVEHLQRWSRLVTEQGLILLEVHCLNPHVMADYLDLSENLSFDAYHAFSRQYLVEADLFLLAAAEAGLFPQDGRSRRYPQTFPFSRITLHTFERRPYQVRPAQLTDMPALLELEKQCWAEKMRISADDISARLARYPLGQLVLLLDHQVVGVVYSQRIVSPEELRGTTFAQLSDLHTNTGQVIQLLSLNILPAKQHLGLGDQLLRFYLAYATVSNGTELVVGITRCKNYPAYRNDPLSEYVQQRNEHGHHIDPILHFHTSHGAVVKGVIDGYRPEDSDNQGAGVLIQYNIRATSLAQAPPEQTMASQLAAKESSIEASPATIIPQAIQDIMGPKRADGFSAKRPLMEMGLDSLDLLELRTLLSQRLGAKLEPTFFFRYSTADAMIDYYKRRKQKQAPVPAAPRRAEHEYTLESSRNNTHNLQADASVAPLEAPLATQTTTHLPAAEPTACPLDIAIIGMACRFPGGVSNPDELWSLLVNGVDAITEVPKTRWDIDDYYGDGAGQIRTRYGGFLDQVDGFDASFFRIAPVEAAAMDPQQRLLLETHWEALEHAGINPETLKGGDTGVYVGIFANDYQLLQSKHVTQFSPYFGTGTSNSVAAGRIAYFLGTEGPAMSVDTACSSSLVAVHLACQSLKRGDSTLALASGVNLLLSPELSVTFSQANMLAPDGRCKTFDAAADGYVRSEGCGVVVLKRLSDAQADGDHILAVIRGTAINQDGASNGLTAPNGLAQESVIRKALDVADLSPQAISYVEAHGTGTSLGDPIEVNALEAVYGTNRSTNNPLTVGSIKTNIGHTEAASGIAGLIKVVLSLQHGYMVPHLHFQAINPHLASSSITIPSKGRKFPPANPKQPRRAAISSFGFSGTNAHAILEQAPAPTAPKLSRRWWRPYHLLTLSAQNDEALHELVQQYATILPTYAPAVVDEDEYLPDIAYTTNIGRTDFDHRFALVAATVSEAREKIYEFTDGQLATGVSQGDVSKAEATASIAFLFTGQGAQYVHMGRELYETQPLFRHYLNQCDVLLQQHLGESLLSILYPAPTTDDGMTHDGQRRDHRRIHQTTYTQPALFALEYALAQLWMSWGIQPDLLMGHSVGELAAACVAGVFSLEDGLKLIATRARLMGALPQDGEMVALLADETQVQQVIARYSHTELAEVSIAAINGPKSIVISGKRAVVLAIADKLATEGVKTRQLTVSHAFHSPLMEPMLYEFSQVAESITYHKPNLPLISNVTGQLAGDEMMTPEYWVRHVREAVRFADGVATLHEQGIGIFLEIGPASTLLGMAGQMATISSQVAMLPSLSAGRYQSDWRQMLASLGELYVRGVEVDWVSFNKPYQRRKVVLPTYPFQRQRYWIETPTAQPSTTSQNGLLNWLDSHPIEQLSEWITDKAHFDAEQRETVSKVLTTLDAEYRAQQVTAQVESMLYEVAWERQSKPMAVVPPTIQGRWLILADDGGVGEALAAQLSELGEKVEIVTTMTHLAELTTQLSSPATALPLRGVVQLWGLDDKIINTQCDVSTLMPSQERNLGSTLHLVQTLTALRGSVSRLWVVTQGAQQLAATEAIAVAQTPLWGLGRVMALEHGDLWGGCIDLGAAFDPSDMAKTLLAELLQAQPDGEREVAYRKGTRYVARLGRGARANQNPVAIQADALYLITGGLGALGLLVANWLVEQGAKHLLLTGRRGISNDIQQAAVEQMEAQGVTIQVAQVDVADEVAMGRLFAQIEAQTDTIPLKGVFHTAGVLDDGILLNQSWPRFAKVLSAKVTGSWLLHQLTEDMPLDMMIFFSSVTSLMGNLGQGNYAAANAFMDGLARYRQQQGLPGLSINWGAWAEAGMAARTTQKMEAIQMITPQIGMSALSQLLAQSGQIGVANIDWAQIGQKYSTLPFFANFVTQEPERKEKERATTRKASLRDQLEALPTSRRVAHLRDYLQQAVGRVLGMTDSPNMSKGFADLGMDSLMALQLRRELEKTLDCSLPPTIAFEYPTVDALTGYLLADVLELTPTTAGAEVESTVGTTQSPRLAAGMDEPIAVISMACRFPGADTPEDFWQLLLDGVDMVQEMPTSRWDVADYYAPERPMPGKMYMREAAFVEHVDQFDPLFFGIAPREAIGMDPQHRLLLEVSWEALERAGIAQRNLIDSQSGVFVGIGESDYGLNSIQNFAEFDTHAVTSAGHSVAAGRLAYTLGLQGPTMAVDTACSSSLVALHLACQSLRAGECKLALAGGVNLMLSPRLHVALSQIQALSPDGRCKTFDASADGYGRGEGGGMVVLKRLSDAKADGNPVLAIIKGSAINHDGPSSGLTVPNKHAQEKLLRQALANAQVTPDEVGYIEAHGTGTPLGDPIEIRALSAVFAAERHSPLLVGSVKSNVGHLEAAAGMAGFVKTVLALHHGQIPQQLHFKTPNPYIEWDEFAIEIPTTVQPWPDKTQVAGVSSFGISGTNAHIVLGAVQNKVETEGKHHDKAKERSWHLLPLSAKSTTAWPDLAARYITQLRINPEISLADLCYSAATARNHFTHRLGLVAESVTDLESKLSAIQEGTEAFGVLSSSKATHGNVGQVAPQIAFLFTGQGAQYVNMGRELYDTQPTFHKIVKECDEILQSSMYLGESLLDILYPSHSELINQGHSLHKTCYTQPALFVLEYALAQLWKSWGIEPDVLMGHSVGEIVAACVAGVFSLKDGLKLISARARLMQALPQDGQMVSVMSDESQIEDLIKPYRDQVSIAAVNGPQSVVISGKKEAIQRIVGRLEAKGIKTRQLKVSHAFHSPLMEPMLDEFYKIAASITYHKPKLPLVSNVTGQLAGDGISTPDYWVRHVRQAVRFADGVATLHEQKIGIFLEIGPASTLLGMAQAISSSDVMLPSLRAMQNHSDWKQMLTSLAELYVQGVEIDWIGFHDNKNRDSHSRQVMLPTYPFQRQRYWVNKSNKSKPGRDSLRPLIDKKMRLPRQKQTIFEKVFSTDRLPFLADHHVYGEVVVPGACHLSLALNAADLLFNGAPCVIQDVIFPQALALLDRQERTVQLIADGRATDAERPFQLISFAENEPDDEPLLHASGRLARSVTTAPLARPTISLSDIQARCQTAVLPETLYDTIAEMQVVLGATFRWFTALWRAESGEMLAQMQLPDAIDSVQGYGLFPSLIDASFQMVGAAMLGDEDPDGELTTKLPFALESLTLYGPTNHQALWCHVKRMDEEHNKWNIDFFTATSSPGSVKQQVIAQISGLQLRAVPSTAILGDRLRTDWLYTIEWEADSQPYAMSQSAQTPDSVPFGHCWLIFGATSGISSTLAASLAADGTPTILVTAQSETRLASREYRRADRYAPMVQQRVLDPTDPAMFKELLNEVATRYQSVGIGYLWGIDDAIPKGYDVMPQSMLTESLHLSAGLLHLVQAMTDSETIGAHLSVVTQGCQSPAYPIDSIIDHNINQSQVASGTLWGLGRTIALEHPRLHCTNIDLHEDAARSSDEQQVRILRQEMMAAMGTAQYPKGTLSEREILYQEGVRHVARLVRHRSLDHLSRDHKSPSTLSASASYLITGGLGALGLEVAEQLVADGARYLILSGRRTAFTDNEPRQRKIEARLRDWQAQGVAVHLIRADVSQRAEGSALLTACHEVAPLRGIIHAAGVLSDGLIQNQSLASLAHVMATKVQGTWLLHELTLETPLDFFVCFSSAASMLGSSGQSNYAAANAFMDSLMQQRQQMGLPALSINWGAWGEVGMAARVVQHQTNGFKPMSPTQARSVLGHLLAQALSAGHHDKETSRLPAQIGVFDIDLPLLQRTLWVSGKNSSLFASLLVEQEQKVTSPAVIELSEQLRPLSARERDEHLSQSIRTEVAQTLGISLPEQISLQRPLFELGLDSLMALELKNKLEQKLNSTWHSTLIFDYPTISQLTAYLLDTLFDESDSDSSLSSSKGQITNGSSQASDDYISQEIEQLSSEDLLAFINQF